MSQHLNQATSAAAFDSATHTITFTFRTDAASLTSYTERHLAHLWHIAQANPAEFGDVEAGDLAEKIGREIIRRWLVSVPPELWNHQGRDHLRSKAMRHHTLSQVAP